MPGVCDPYSPEYDEEACLELGGTPAIGGTGDDGARIIRKGNDGQYYELKGDEWTLLTGMPDALSGLEDDLVGLTPVTAPGTKGTSGEYGAIGEGISRGFNPGLPQGRTATALPTPYYEDSYGELYDRGGNPITEAQRKRLLGLGVGDGTTDPYAGAANARAERALQEQIRAQRIREAQDQADAIMERTQAAQQARLAGAQFSVTPSMSDGYFPGLGPSSPLVRQGLADPFQFQPQGFNPERGVNLNEQQIANDLAMIRRAAGQSG